MEQEFDSLKLDNQLCFPLYACAKEIVRRYTPFLEPLGLTYTQYITMMVLWEHKEINAKKIGEKLLLDSGTLTPVLKRLEEKGLVVRCRARDDERNLQVTITPEGEELKQKARDIPMSVAQCIGLSEEDAVALNQLLHSMLGKMRG